MPVALIRADSLYAWKGSSLLITTARGECSKDLPLAGYYYREARFLQTLRFECNGQSLWLCEAASEAPDRLTLTYVHPEITQPASRSWSSPARRAGLVPWRRGPRRSRAPAS